MRARRGIAARYINATNSVKIRFATPFLLRAAERKKKFIVWELLPWDNTFKGTD